MSSRVFMLLVGTVTLMMGIVTFAGAEEDQPDNDTDLRLLVVPEYTSNGVIARVLIENIGKNKVTILKEFSPFPIFFAFRLVSADKTPIGSIGAGKISFDRELSYVSLEPREVVGTSVRLEDIFPNVKKGDYELAVTYHNQYGEGCFRGKLVSQSVRITIK